LFLQDVGRASGANDPEANYQRGVDRLGADRLDSAPGVVSPANQSDWLHAMMLIGTGWQDQAGPIPGTGWQDQAGPITGTVWQDQAGPITGTVWQDQAGPITGTVWQDQAGPIPGTHWHQESELCGGGTSLSPSVQCPAAGM
jgi:hypothetical protein